MRGSQVMDVACEPFFTPSLGSNGCTTSLGGSVSNAPSGRGGTVGPIHRAAARQHRGAFYRSRETRSQGDFERLRAFCRVLAMTAKSGLDGMAVVSWHEVSVDSFHARAEIPQRIALG
jgi:hypothetical protein